jgi:arsenite/tail-anchored protein-transporting ATPase
VPNLAFFVGKGGVGKTTVAAAYALRTAFETSARRVLLVSTDPAHSLGDVLERKLGSLPKLVPAVSSRRLWAWELDPSALFREFLREYRQHILDIVERGSLFSAQEISPLLDTALPGMSEISALLAIRDAIESGSYSHIVVDTAPFGHTLRLFSLPEQFTRLLTFLELAAQRDRVLAEHFGGNLRTREPRLIRDWQAKVLQLTQAFAASHLFLVTTAEPFALNESVRCVKDLRKTTPTLALKGVVLNRAILEAEGCPRCRHNAVLTGRAESFLRKHFRSSPVYVAEDPGFPILGSDALRRFGEHAFGGKPLRLKPQRPKLKSQQGLRLAAAEWPKLNSRLSFVLGKGGVGKTTVSAALGFRCRQVSRLPVEICSVDPAPSLDDIFQTDIGDSPVPVLGDEHFRASELDAVALFESWIREIRQEVASETSREYNGVHLDLAFERQLLSALLDIVPPGLDEVLAIFRISDLRTAGSTRIIIDMAPTGHALELLRMPERIVTWSRLLLKSLAVHRKLALARNIAVRVAELELRARELARVLRNSSEASICCVMLPEPLPDRETERLLRELDGLELKPQLLFVNRIILAEDSANCARCQIAAEWQRSVLSSIQRKRFAQHTFLIRDFANEIAGVRGLNAITRELWRLHP